ncbi:hypothetical protein K435DRAFT_913887 [Dendrothele bispora CBS 962.96]|uniref:Uncharacterized protein n=1 Tax=Dendrothele bispora (strain CBS 962.96) TaxID=1314807 RepID=A0A4V4HHP1_DENBC|nr:hypothetical protein K435DRAFT_913887 [Dendrothele bispora CBS 962.96]
MGNKTHRKAWCKCCVAKAIRITVDEENRALSEGTLRRSHSVSEIEDEVIVKMAQACGTVVKFGQNFELRTLKGQIEVLYKHLRDCPLTTEETKDEARAKLSLNPNPHHDSSSASLAAVNVTPLPSQSPTPLLPPIPQLVANTSLGIPPLVLTPLPTSLPTSGTFYGVTEPKLMTTTLVNVHNFYPIIHVQSDKQVWALIGEIKKAENLKVLYGTKEGEDTSGDTKSTVYNCLAERLDPTRWVADRKKTADHIKHKLRKLETDFKKAVKCLKKTGEGIEE